MLNYNAPDGSGSGARSTIDTGGNADQMRTFSIIKKSIITARREQFFMPLASVTNMPKHYGKTIKVYEYIPLLDDRNVNSQGIDAAGVTSASGNLYGSSRDIGTITSKMPTLTENGGRVNRVGFTRIEREGSFHNFGFFFDFTQDSMDFDTDEGLMDHLARELMTGAVQLTEAVLQRDLLAAAGVILYAGGATNNATVAGEVLSSIPAAILNYRNFMRLDAILTDNRTPRNTTVISGSRMIDTRTIPAARVMFVGSEVVPMLKGLTDLFGVKAFIAIQHYASAGTILNGEIGSIDAFRIIQVPEMLHWAGLGAAVTTNPGYRTTTVSGVEHYDIFPLMVVGDDSFTTIGFQTDGKSVKFNVLTKMPGRETATRDDPYGKTGFSSIQWWYGMLVKRPERIAIMKTVAPI